MICRRKRFGGEDSGRTYCTAVISGAWTLHFMRGYSRALPPGGFCGLGTLTQPLMPLYGLENVGASHTHRSNASMLVFADGTDLEIAF